MAIKAGGAKRGQVEKVEKPCPRCGTKMIPVKRMPGGKMFWSCQNVKHDAKTNKCEVMCDYSEPLRKR